MIILPLPKILTLNPFKSLFKDTFIYGLAAVLPRLLTFLLVFVYTDVFNDKGYGVYSVSFTYVIFFNVILSYGMETTLFRFYTKNKSENEVVSTAGISMICSSLIFLLISILFNDSMANTLQIKAEYYKLITWILFFDALCVIPFAYLRIEKKSINYALIKLFNVVINFGLNIFFLYYLVQLKEHYSFFNSIYLEDFNVNYIFISLIIASAFTLLILSPFFIKLKYHFNFRLWKKMMSYSWPILVAGLAFSINEALDKLLLNFLLPENIAEAKVGVYSACYKLGVFMTLFATAFRLGVEPFFFSHAQTKNPKKAYALITKYFVILGVLIMLCVTVFIDYLKLMLQKEEFYEALKIVPILLLANLCLGVYHSLSVWYKITDKTKFGAFISSVGALITLTINIVFIAQFEYMASVTATLLAYGAMMILSYVLGRKHYYIDYPLKKIGFYALIGICFTGLSFYVFRGSTGIGVFFILIYLLLFYIFEKKELLYYLKKPST